MNVVRSAQPGIRARSFSTSRSWRSAVTPRLHCLQQAVARVLERHVEVRQHAGRVRERVEHGVGERARIQVQEAHPVEAVDSVERADQLGDLRPAREVLGIGQGVLRDHVDLAHPLPRQHARLGHDRFRCTALELAPDRRDRTEGTDPVAPFSDLQVGGVAGAEQEPRRRLVVQVRAARVHVHAARAPRARVFQNPGDVLELAGADERVDLGQLLGELGAVALGQAARDDQRPERPALLLVRQLEDGVDRLLARARDEGAGVHDRDVRVRQILGDRAARERELPEHDLGVDLVLGAAERPEEDAGRGGGGRHRRGRLA